MARVTTRAGRVLPQLLRERRDFRRFWTGQTISLFGDQVTLLALPLVGVLVLHASPAQMGYLAAAGLAPNLLLSLHAGAWVDRHGRRRRIMIAADLGRAGLLATVPLAYALGRETLFVSVAPRDRFVEANSLLYGSRAFSFVGGPSLGGLLVQLLSAPVALLADAGSFVASALFLGRIRAAEPPAETNPRGNLRAGARWIRQHRLDLRRGDPGPAARPRHGRLHGRQLRRAPTRLPGRRRARQHSRPAPNPVDRGLRRPRRRPLAAPLPGPTPRDPSGHARITVPTKRRGAPQRRRFSRMPAAPIPPPTHIVTMP